MNRFIGSIFAENKIFLPPNRFQYTSMLRKKFIQTLLFTVIAMAATAQPSAYEGTNSRYLKSASMFARVEDSLKKEFSDKGLEWPVKFMYIRSFKLEKQMEVWVKNDYAETFQLFKTYKVCATSGTFGPKRKEGDKQIPEGFYYINEFNPNSNYHLALGLNYPNVSDQLLSDPAKPGGDIYIHGNCVTIGCLPITDSLIEQVYYLASVVKEQGQDFIPVHIFPFRFDNLRSTEQYLVKTKARTDVQQFAASIRMAYEYFEDTHQLPAIMIAKNGGYLVSGDPAAPKIPRVKAPIPEDPKDPYAVWNLVEKVDKVPQPKEGNAALQKWLFNLSKELSATLPENTTMSLQIEFIVDKEGNTHLAKVTRGGSSQINSIVSKRFEKELKWLPALKDGEAVNTRLRQNLNLVAPEDLD